ncbi:hypothetical protein, partial [Salmonella enterica]|uniref:hypothetical protein n=1 Tax=Salmonella enterica TaxID=28901 RepID=UPI00329744F2
GGVQHFRGRHAAHRVGFHLPVITDAGQFAMRADADRAACALDRRRACGDRRKAVVLIYVPALRTHLRIGSEVRRETAVFRIVVLVVA